MKNKAYIFYLILIVSALALMAVIMKGRTVEILDHVNFEQEPKVAENHSPQRIVSLAPNITEILFELGLGERVVAVSSDSDWPVEAKQKKKVGSFWQPNIESILAAKPDLIVSLINERQNSVGQSLKNSGYDVLSLKLEKLEELFPAIEKTGLKTNSSKEAKELIERIENELAGIQKKLGNCEKVKVLWSIQNEPLRVVGRKTFINDIIELAGGVNAIGFTIQQYPPISSEQVIACSADVIVQPVSAKEIAEKQQNVAMAFWSKWPNLPAVKNKRIHLIDADISHRLGPRFVMGVEIVARILHPERFEGKGQ